MHLFSSKFFSHFVFAGSRFDRDTEVEFDDISFGISNEITDLALKGWLTHTPSTRHSMVFGFEAKMFDFDLNYIIVDLDYLNSFSGNYFALYLHDNYKLSVFDIIQAGVRFDHYTDGNYSRITPRLSFKHIFSDQVNMRLNYGRFSQFLNLVYQQGFSFADM